MNKLILRFFVFCMCVVSMVMSCSAAGLLVNTGFPETASDVSFANMQDNQVTGYAPFKDAVVYSELDIEDEEKALERELNRLEAQRVRDAASMSNAEYCEKYFDEEKCAADRGRLQEVIAIGNAPGVETGAVQPTVPGVSVPTTPGTQVQPVPGSGRVAPGAAGAVAFNNRAHKGPCTPSAVSNHFYNKILTTGKYESIHPAFEKMMVQIFRVEGECGGHPADDGGYTCYGYAQNYNRDIDVRKLTRAGAEDRTYQRFFLARGLDKLPDAISGDVLRGDFGSGPGAGVKKLQQTLGLPKTGKVDETLIRAVENYNGDIHQAYWDTMQNFYVDITVRKPQKKVFLKGWMNGVKHFRENGCHVVPVTPLTR